MRALIVDDHPLFRDALTLSLQRSEHGFEVVEATTLDQALEELARDGIALALLDLSMPGVQGFEGLLQIRTQFPRIPVVIVSGYDDNRIISQALSYGAAGFIPKSASPRDIASAVSEVMDGAVYVPPSYQPPESEVTNPDQTELLRRLATLTPQQMRVLQMLRQGMLNKQIAFDLQVGETTIKAHVSEILRKLKVYSRTQAVIEVTKLEQADLLKGFDTFS